MKLKITAARLAFPSLFEAKSVQGEGKPAFSGSLLLSKDDAQVKAINGAIEAVAKEKWGAKSEAVLKQLRAADKTALHDGEIKSQYEGFDGCVYIAARNTARPTVIAQDKTPLTAEDGKPYAGCYVHAVVEIWAQDNTFGKRINATLMGVQFFRDGDSFSGGGVASAADDFDDISAGASADDLI